MSADYRDAHNHLHDERLAPHLPEVIEALRTAGVTRCVVNGTCEADWPAVADLARTHPDLVHPSFGLHPWKAADRSDGWLERLEERLEQFPGSGIGECGLDRWIDNHDLPDQTGVFLAQLGLAARLDRPLSIHCLQAWGALLEALQDHPRPERGFLLHSYGGSAEMVPQFAELGAWFSFSGHFLHPRKESAREAFRQVPPDRLLVESDAPDMCPPSPFAPYPLNDPDGTPLNHPANLPAITRGLAKALGRGPEDLHEQSLNNFDRFFTAST